MHIFDDNIFYMYFVYFNISFYSMFINTAQPIY